MTAKTDKMSEKGKSNETKLKRFSKSKRTHERRLKQEARKTADITPAHA
jgi:hypothetical protein